MAATGSTALPVLDGMIDTASLLLSRADGVGGSVAPIKVGFDDVGTPFDGELCDCHEEGMDGFYDLTMKFSATELTGTLDLGMAEGALEMVLTGTLLDGTPFVGADCIRLVPVKAMAGMRN